MADSPRKSSTSEKEKQYIPREHYLNVTDTVELCKAIVLLQNPLDDGERLNKDDLADWSLTELQVSATIQSGVYWGNQQIIPQFFGKVVRPTEQDITNLRQFWTAEMQRRSNQYLKNLSNKKENEKNKNKEKSVDNDDNVTTDGKMDDMDELVETESTIAARITSGGSGGTKRGRRQMESSMDNVNMGFNDSHSNDNSNDNDNSNNNRSNTSSNVSSKNGFNKHGVRIGNAKGFTFSTKRSEKGGKGKGKGKGNSSVADINKQQINAARARSLLRAQQQILENGKFASYRVYEGRNGVRTYFAVSGDQLISTAGRPEGYDSDDDVFSDDFKADLNHRPFFEFWSIVNGDEANKKGRV